MDSSKVSQAEGHSYAGAVIEHRRFGGAGVCRIMHPPHQRIDAHEHDRPTLAIYRLGDFEERTEEGAEVAFDGPSFVFQPAGAEHEDIIGGGGLETLTMMFDPAWLSAEARAALPRVTHWQAGGAVVLAARRLAEDWENLALSEAEIGARTSRFLVGAFAAESSHVSAPSWGARVMADLSNENASTDELAQRLALHPAWLARAYRAWRGEGLGETVRRKRVERAAIALRASADALADVAVASGFCDQSHMNRAFGAVLGRTPLEVRRESVLLASLA
ncbi:MAG: AraC family transcriptional regulator [Terricaulis sp.]